MHEFTRGLNDRQIEAATSAARNILVLAGAGSGKTTVLVRRIGWLVATGQCSSRGIVAMTFTNKAARELRERVESTGCDVGGMWVGTFHWVCLRLLRKFHQQVGLPPGFNVIDRSDQNRIVKQILTDIEVQDEEDALTPRAIIGFISSLKENGVRADAHQASVKGMKGVTGQVRAEIYLKYEDHCEREHVLDFSEILLRTLELLQRDEGARDWVAHRVEHVLVDEFQDTNPIQFALMTLLAGTSPTTVVGDDDQSIYGWRGARVENMQRYLDERQADIVRLERNYRSSGRILGVANAVIASNHKRLGKTLWTDADDGEPVHVYRAFDQQDEANYVVRCIREALKKGTDPADIAVLYRVRAQSRDFEMALTRAGVAYQIRGGARFWDRAEIRYALGYLRLAHNPHDDAALLRIINFPRRGLGDKAQDTLRDVATQRQTSIWDVIQDTEAVAEHVPRARKRVAELRTCIERITRELSMQDSDLAAYVRMVLEQSGLLAYYRKEAGAADDDRVRSLGELVNAAGTFDWVAHAADIDRYDEDQAGVTVDVDTIDGTPLSLFLEQTSIGDGDADAGDPDATSVNLMTVHAAKGLEFDVVLTVGVEDEQFPLVSFGSDRIDDLQEERRLFYVAVTRARRQLHLTSAEQRMIYGKTKRRPESQFLKEVPAHLLARVRSSALNGFAHAERPRARPLAAPADGELVAGVQVLHNQFGDGVILHTRRSGSQALVYFKRDRATHWMGADSLSVKAGL